MQRMEDYKEIPGLTVSALRELDAAHCDPGVLFAQLPWW